MKTSVRRRQRPPLTPLEVQFEQHPQRPRSHVHRARRHQLLGGAQRRTQPRLQRRLRAAVHARVDGGVAVAQRRVVVAADVAALVLRVRRQPLGRRRAEECACARRRTDRRVVRLRTRVARRRRVVVDGRVAAAVARGHVREVQLRLCRLHRLRLDAVPTQRRYTRSLQIK